MYMYKAFENVLNHLKCKYASEKFISFHNLITLYLSK